MNIDYYAHEYREFNKGFKNRRRMQSGCDPLYFIWTVLRLLFAIVRLLFDIARWLFRTARRKQ